MKTIVSIVVDRKFGFCPAPVVHNESTGRLGSSGADYALPSSFKLCPMAPDSA